MNRHLKAWLAAAGLALYVAVVYAACVWNGPLVMAVYCIAVLVALGYLATAS